MTQCYTIRRQTVASYHVRRLATSPVVARRVGKGITIAVVNPLFHAFGVFIAALPFLGCLSDALLLVR